MYWPTPLMTEQWGYVIAQESKMLCFWLSKIYKHTFWVILCKQIKLKNVSTESEEIRPPAGDLLGHSVPLGSLLHFLILGRVCKEKEMHTLWEITSLYLLSNSLFNFPPKLNPFPTILCNSPLAFMFTPNIQMFINRYHAHF